ncbi:diketogulonate reductase-like aldo/keto reductase [Paenibacillus amylolyticus]|uniref:Diketogulonate reductase-like aldo/keto reductase n=1 Tax=Paenibacillus amylolyticus TaxID=1451 RepID=A0AAP5H506_PAEAM|nr:aldo/keto reductase [Paenibacillus amylolyticus]MDR6726444.1 diketogulonate reductase-like aldo/keto reductase [Paenibacillus amylolyticus]
MKHSIPQYTLNDGLQVPAIGFGTYSLKGEEGVKSIVSAIDVGYRLIDTAYNYENEATVGKAVKQSSVPREELLISSKLPGRYHAYDKALVAIQESLYRADLDYYDLYLIHWPNPKKDVYVEAWQALIEAKKRGYIRSIGVSNFLPEHNERLIKETGVAPSLNQIELHPFFDQTNQREQDTKHGIVNESWSPIGRGNDAVQDIVKDDKILRIAEAHGKTPTQIILRWHIQLGSIPIPKASSLQHQQENIDIFDFELNAEEMQVISSFSRPDGRLWDQDPSEYEEF